MLQPYHLAPSLLCLSARTIVYIYIDSLIPLVCRSTQSELETERGVREKAEGELMDCRRQLSEVGEKVVSLEETVTKSSQTNSDLNAQLV